MALFSINTTLQTTTEFVPARTQAFRWVLVLSSPVGFLDAGLFVFLRDGNIDIFQCVAAPSQLADLPLGAPTSVSEGFFRLDTADLTFQDRDEALENLDCIQAELKLLCNEMAKAQTDLSAPTSGTIASDL